MRTRRVLIVDDEDDIREIAQMSMEIGGWDVITASCGQDALREATRVPLDVILLDVMMPDLDGPQTLELLREDPHSRNIPVIFLTAKVQVSEQRQLLDLRSCGVIAKPFDPMCLADEVTKIMKATA